MKQYFAAFTALATLALAGAAHAEAGDFQIRLRAIGVLPTESAGGINPALPTASVGVDNAYTGEVDFTYFFTKHIGAELILATSNHDVTGRGALSGIGKIIDARVLPPTLTVQYHFNPDGKFRPYLGAGVNYSVFYGVDATQTLVDAIGPVDVSADSSLGWAVQGGIDYAIDKHWFVNVDLKYVSLDTRVTLHQGATRNSVNVDLDPLIVGVGVGYRF
ncbi:MAG: OmpW family protein [Sphingomonadales bacterium]|nr:MAG: OmpW family protein [Sphingomonadales bacterium]